MSGNNFLRDIKFGDVMDLVGSLGANKLFEQEETAQPEPKSKFSSEFIFGLRRFLLQRKEDASDVSGTGYVAWGVRFPDGTCVLRWRTKTSSTAVYASIDQLISIHGHEGSTTIEWID